MLTILLIVALIWVAWKILFWSFKTAWGIALILATVILAPLIIIAFFCVGLIYIALPFLIIVGIVILIGKVARTVL